MFCQTDKIDDSIHFKGMYDPKLELLGHAISSTQFHATYNLYTSPFLKTLLPPWQKIGLCEVFSMHCRSYPTTKRYGYIYEIAVCIFCFLIMVMF